MPISVTQPALAVPLLRLLGDHPLVTTVSVSVAQGAMMPPGHMQKE
jgi:hypothetical protein